MLAKVTPAVVSISVIGTDEGPLDNPFLGRIFNPPDDLSPVAPRNAVGSGVIVDAELGRVITNYHVIAGVEHIVVTLADRRRLEAKVIGGDPDTDIALLSIDAHGLTEAVIGDSDTLAVGDFVAAIGYPFGLGQAVTSGIVSALGRSGLGIESYEDFIQTDASINPGSSGGALVDFDGKLVGISTALISAHGARGNIGVGFAVPINMALGVTRELAAHGEVRRGKLGIRAQDVTPDLAQALGLATQTGAMVTSVQPGSSAARAGIAVGDVIVEAAGAPVQSSADLRNKAGLVTGGTELAVTLLRNGRRQTVRPVLEGQPGFAQARPAEARLDDPVDALRGTRLATLETFEARRVKQAGVLVAAVEQDSLPSFAGLREGDVIVAVNRRMVASVDDLRRALRESPRPIALGVVRDPELLFVLIR
jgi:serine protease DegQ